MAIEIMAASQPGYSKETLGGWRLNADVVLKAAARFWLLTVVIGQWILVYYITVYYGSLIFGQGLEGLKEFHLPNGFVPGGARS